MKTLSNKKKNNYTLALSFIIPSLFLLFIFIWYGFEPFGDGNKNSYGLWNINTSDEVYAERTKNIGNVKRTVLKNNNTTIGYSIRPNELKSPSGLALVADTGKLLENPPVAYYLWFSRYTVASHYLGIWRIHSDRANIGFYDGHVGNMNAEEMRNCPMAIETSYSETGVQRIIR